MSDLNAEQNTEENIEQNDEEKAEEKMPYDVGIPVPLNPYLSDFQQCFPTHRHPAHKHPLIASLVCSSGIVVCDNTSCQRRLTRNSTRFTCPACDFDLCEWCFQLDYQGPDQTVPANDEHSNNRLRVIRNPLQVAVRETGVI
jgi:hypothetical protein